MEHNKFQNRRWTYGNGKKQEKQIRIWLYSDRAWHQNFSWSSISKQSNWKGNIQASVFWHISQQYSICIDPYIFPEKADTKSAMRKRLDVILDKLNDRDLSILEATAIALCKAKEQPEDWPLVFLSPILSSIGRASLCRESTYVKRMGKSFIIPRDLPIFIYQNFT